jgi:hypothetical protein
VPLAYETLIDPLKPFGACFGWQIFVREDFDLGGAGFGLGTWRRDLLVHSEAADFVGSMGVVVRPDVGALFVYFGDSNVSPGSLVNGAAPVKLQTPANTGLEPQTNERFGRGAGMVHWKKENGEPVDLLLVGSPSRDIEWPAGSGQWVSNAGAVFAFQTPIDGPYGANHVWGTFVLLEPADHLSEGPGTVIDQGGLQPQVQGEWGAWMVVGRYNLALPLDQILVCSRERTANGVPGAGQVYSLHLPLP